ncbi:hypothetical protein [Amycolatopsis sp. lyj-84]|uniref:hypothetical protein n=1 Tax=Amycolatopsis sp. lyj-84 TaxID=2789284 RepID=UPI003979EE4E
MVTLHTNVTVDSYAEVLQVAEAAMKTAKEKRDRLEEKFDRRTAPRSEFETDPAIVSGIRRRTTGTQRQRADRKMELDLDAYNEFQSADQTYRGRLARVTRLRRAVPVPYTEEELKAAKAVRTDDGWYRLLKVNRVTVGVEAGFPWPHKVNRERILEVHPSEGGTVKSELATFFEVGRQAFLAGEHGAPALNPAVREAIKDMEVGTGAASIMLAFQEGWRAAYVESGGTIHFLSPGNPEKTACTTRLTEPILSGDPREVTCDRCRDTEHWREHAEMAEIVDSLPEATETEPDRITILRKAVADFAMVKIDGTVVDVQTANAIVAVYDHPKIAAHPTFRDKFVTMPVVAMANLAWKLISKR